MYLHQAKNSSGAHSYEAFIFQNHELAPQFHRNYELVYVIDGVLELIIDGRRSVLESGDFALCLSNEVHEHHSIGPTKSWYGIFSPDFVPEFHNAVKGKTAADCRFRCDESLMPYLQQNLLFHGTPDFYRLSAALHMVCGEFLQNVMLVDRNHQEYMLMNDIVDYIADNYKNKLTLKDVAQALGYDYYYFSKLFHQAFGQSFSEYLNTYRFNNALCALRNSSRSVSEIAAESGFQSIRSFNAAFLKRMGTSPAQYRKHIRNNDRR